MSKIISWPKKFHFLYIQIFIELLSPSQDYNICRDTLTFLIQKSSHSQLLDMFKSSIGHFYFLDIHIIPEQLSLSWYSNLCRASDGGGRVDTGSVVGEQLGWGSWRSVQQQQQQWCRKIQQLPLWGMLIHNVHKVKNPQINCDPWTEGVYQGSYTLKEVCLAQNS